VANRPSGSAHFGSKRTSATDAFALDALMPWLRRTPAAPVGKCKDSGAAQTKSTLRLPPVPTRKNPKKNQKHGKKTRKPLTIPAKDFAIFLLRAGAEIEHSLLIQYLYAAYSINDRAGNNEVNLGLQWKTAMRLVAREEMAHLVTVQNLLLSLGAGIYLDRGSLHKSDRALPLPFKLERLSRESVSKYVVFESPSTGQIDPKYSKLVCEIREKLGKKSRVLSVLGIYAAIYWLFKETDDLDADWPFTEADIPKFIGTYGHGFHLEDSDFGSRARYSDLAASPEEWEIFEGDTHVDGGSPRDAALASLRWIMAQGEGPSAIEDSHFVRFVSIYKQLARGRSESLRIRVPDNPIVRGLDPRTVRRADTTPIRNPRAKLWAELVNARYQLMVLDIFCSLNASRAREAENRRRFAQWAVTEMEFVKKIGQMLPMMFRGKSKKTRAGAAFQQVRTPKDETERDEFRRRWLALSDACISGLRSPHSKMPKYTDDNPTVALEPALLDSIARQNDEMREVLRLA
jgi:Ferritin-like